MERKYKASTALRVLSLGIFQHAVSIKNGVLRTTCGFLFRIKPIKIENITYVECYAKKVWAKGGYVDETYYKFVVKGEEHRLLRFYVLDAKEMQQLLKDIRQLNPKVEYSVEIRAFMNTYIKPYKIHLDFTPADQKPKAELLAKMRRPFILQHPSVDVAHNWLMIILVMAPIFIGYSSTLGILLRCFGNRTNSMFIPPMVASFFPLFNVGMELSLALYGSSDGWQKIKKNLYIAAICLFLGLLFGSLGVVI